MKTFFGSEGNVLNLNPNSNDVIIRVSWRRQIFNKKPALKSQGYDGHLGDIAVFYLL